jgi:hypothetical protein
MEVDEKVTKAFKHNLSEFAKEIAPYYKVLNWIWSNFDERSRVPTEEEIYSTVNRLYFSVMTNALKEPFKQGLRSTGGIEVRYDPWDSGPSVSVQFVVKRAL